MSAVASKSSPITQAMIDELSNTNLRAANENRHLLSRIEEIQRAGFKGLAKLSEESSQYTTKRNEFLDSLKKATSVYNQNKHSKKAPMFIHVKTELLATVKTFDENLKKFKEIANSLQTQPRVETKKNTKKSPPLSASAKSPPPKPKPRSSSLSNQRVLEATNSDLFTPNSNRDKSDTCETNPGFHSTAYLDLDSNLRPQTKISSSKTYRVSSATLPKARSSSRPLERLNESLLESSRADQQGTFSNSNTTIHTFSGEISSIATKALNSKSKSPKQSPLPISPPTPNLSTQIGDEKAGRTTASHPLFLFNNPTDKSMPAQEEAHDIIVSTTQNTESSRELTSFEDPAAIKAGSEENSSPRQHSESAFPEHRIESTDNILPSEARLMAQKATSLPFTKSTPAENIISRLDDEELAEGGQIFLKSSHGEEVIVHQQLQSGVLTIDELTNNQVASKPSETLSQENQTEAADLDEPRSSKTRGLGSHSIQNQTSREIIIGNTEEPGTQSKTALAFIHNTSFDDPSPNECNPNRQATESLIDTSSRQAKLTSALYSRPPEDVLEKQAEKHVELKENKRKVPNPLKNVDYNYFKVQEPKDNVITELGFEEVESSGPTPQDSLLSNKEDVQRNSETSASAAQSLSSSTSEPQGLFSRLTSVFNFWSKS